MKSDNPTFLKNIIKLIKLIFILTLFGIVLPVAYLMYQDIVAVDSNQKKTKEMFANHINEVIGNPEDKINSDDILWYTREDSERGGYDPEDSAAIIYFVQLKDFKRKEISDEMGDDIGENRKKLANFSYDYNFGTGYYILYTISDLLNYERIWLSKVQLWFSVGHPESRNEFLFYESFTDTYKLEQNMFTISSSGKAFYVDERNPLQNDMSFSSWPNPAFDDFFEEVNAGNASNFQKYMSKYNAEVNEAIKVKIQYDTQSLKKLKRNMSLFYSGSGSGSCSSLSGGDWVYPNFDNATAAFKFNSNNTFNYSNTYTNTSRYGKWKSINDCAYQLKYRNGNVQTIYISGDSFTIGSTEYRKY